MTPMPVCLVNVIGTPISDYSLTVGSAPTSVNVAWATSYSNHASLSGCTRTYTLVRRSGTAINVVVTTDGTVVVGDTIFGSA